MALSLAGSVAVFRSYPHRTAVILYRDTGFMHYLDMFFSSCFAVILASFLPRYIFLGTFPHKISQANLR